LKLRYAVLALIIIAICRIIFLAGGQAQAQSMDSIDAVAGVTPTIDGIVEAGEWDDASVVVSVVAVYVKQDGENLYIALDIPDNTPHDLDGLLVCFDVNHNAGPKPQGDDTKIVVTRFGVQAEYVGNGTNWVTTANSGWDAATSSTSTKWQAELNVSYTKLGSPYGSSPGESDHLSPDTWGDLISSANWIPEFPSLIILPLFMIATLLAGIIYKEKPRNARE